MTQETISQKAQENLKTMKEWRDEPSPSGEFITLVNGQSKTLLFDLEDIHVQTVVFPNQPEKKVKRGKYGVFDVSEKRYDKQYLSTGKNLSLAIDSNLEEGNRVLKITKSGESFDTKYSVVATSLPADYQKS